MENNTAIPIVAVCRSPPTMYEHEPLWITAMVVVSAISTLTAMLLRKRRARASARVPRARPPPQPREGEEEEMVYIGVPANDDSDDK